MIEIFDSDDFKAKKNDKFSMMIERKKAGNDVEGGRLRRDFRIKLEPRPRSPTPRASGFQPAPEAPKAKPFEVRGLEVTRKLLELDNYVFFICEAHVCSLDDEATPPATTSSNSEQKNKDYRDSNSKI